MQLLNEERIQKMRHAHRIAVRELGLLGDAYFDIGVTLAERHLLIEMAHLDEISVTEMAEKLLLDKSSASRLITRAVKKGFLVQTTDPYDKRRRLLQLTKEGRRSLTAFEAIAQRQAADALNTLNEDEIEKVYDGIALFSRGLTEARLREKIRKKLPLFGEPLQAVGYTLDLYQPEDERELYAIFRDVVETGRQFPYTSSSTEEFKRTFFRPLSRFLVCHTREGRAIGGFYLRTNVPESSEQVANAAYMIHRDFRGQGLGRLLVQASLAIAKELGYKVMQYNRVFSDNAGPFELYKRLGFEVVNGTPEEGYAMVRQLS